MKKRFLKKLYLLTIIGIILLLQFSCSVPGEETKSSEDFEVKQLAKIDLGDNQYVQINETTDGDVFVIGLSSSEELTMKLCSMTPVEIYEKYSGEKAASELVEAQTRSNFVPNKSNLLDSIQSGPNKMSYWDTRSYYFSIFPNTIIKYATASNTSSDQSYKLKTKSPYYVSAVAGAETGSFTYKMYVRVIRTFQSNYWQTVGGPIYVPTGLHVWSYWSPNKYREVKSRVYGNTGSFHHIVGGN